MNSLQLEIEKVLKNLEEQNEINELELMVDDDDVRNYSIGAGAAYGDAIYQLKEALEVTTQVYTES